MKIQDRWSLSLWRSFCIDAATSASQKRRCFFMGMYLATLILNIYIDQHGPYLNVIDVSLITTAVLFFLLAILALFFSDNDKDNKK